MSFTKRVPLAVVALIAATVSSASAATVFAPQVSIPARVAPVAPRVTPPPAARVIPTPRPVAPVYTPTPVAPPDLGPLRKSDRLKSENT
jgi:hypothetical protein